MLSSFVSMIKTDKYLPQFFFLYFKVAEVNLCYCDMTITC